MIAAFATTATPATEEMTDDVLDLLQEEGAMKGFLMLFALLGGAAVSRFADAATEYTLRAHMLGVLEVEDDPSAPAALAAQQEVSFTGLPFAEAVSFFRRKVPMSDADFAALEDRYKARGFAVAGGYDLFRLHEAHQILADTLSSGANERQALDRLQELLPDEGRFHLQTVYDQAMLGSAAAGRYEQLTHPDVVRARPYWQYRTAGDNRVRATHRVLDGKVFPVDSEVWQQWFPPNGFRCRCSVLSLSAADLRERGLRSAERLPRQVETEEGQVVQMQPDPGFSGSPATQRAADATVERIRELGDRGVLAQSPEDLRRDLDAERAKKVDRYTGLTEAAVKEQLGATPVFNVYDQVETVPPGEIWVDWHMYSQNLPTAEQLVTRAVQTEGLYGLRDRIALQSKATYFAGYDREGWPDPEVVYDDGLARDLGIEPSTVARSTEYALRFVVTPGELAKLLAFLQQHGERGPGRSAVARAWETADIRVRAGKGAKLPEAPLYRQAWRNRRLEAGREIVTLSQKPRADFDEAEAVLVNASLWRWL